MCARVVVQEGRSFLSMWKSGKAMRLAVLLGSLLTVSVAVNAMIILAAGSRL
jgi:hypothetical protein